VHGADIVQLHIGLLEEMVQIGQVGPPGPLAELAGEELLERIAQARQRRR
jgi:hypothetical protein